MNDELNSQNAEITYPDALQLVIKKKKRCAYIVDGELYLRLGASDDEETRDGATLRNLRMRVRYFDAGTETIQIGWSINGTSETNTATIVTKTNTNKWKTAKYKFAAVLGGDQYPDQEYGDVRIVSTGELYVEYVITKDLDDGSEFVWSAATNATALATEDSESDDYEAGTAGWFIDRDTGKAQFTDLLITGEIHTSVFVKDVVNVQAGTIMVAKSAGALAAKMNVPSAGTWTAKFNDPPGGGFLFANNDICYIKGKLVGGGIGATYFTVSARVSNSDGTQSYTCTWNNGTKNVTYRNGQGVTDLGVNGDGYLVLTADAASGAPSYSVYTHSGSPWTDAVLRGRFGNLNGIVDATLNPSGYGIYTTNGFFSGTLVATVGSIGGWTINSTYLAKDTGVNSTSAGLSPTDYPFYAGATYANRATAPFRVTPAGVLVASNATITGTITATVGSIGGWTISSGALTATNAVLDSTNQEIRLGSGNNIVVLDAADATYRLWIGNAVAASAPFRVTQAGAVTASNIDLAGGTVSGTFTVSGTLRSAASPNARYELTSVGWKSYDSGNVQRTQILNDGSGWLGSSSVFSWTAAGVVSLNGSAVVGNSLDADKVTFTAPTLSGLTLTNNSPSAGYVAWSSFKLTYQGVTYTVSSGNSNNKYIYWKKSVSTTVLQTSATIPTNAPDMFIVVVNFSGTAYQSNFAPFIYADYISVGQLSAISADMGSITAGTITGGTIRTAASGARTEMHASNLFGLGFGGIGGTDGTTAQWYAKASDGKLYAAGGDWVVDASGQKLPVATSWDTKKGLRWETGGNVVSRLWSLSVDSTTNWTYLESVPAGSVTASEMLVASESSGTAIAIAILRARNGASTPADLRVYYKPSDARPNYAYVQGDLKTADGTYDLGVNGGAWRNAWVSGNVNAGGVLPYTNNADDIGSNSMRWQDVWIGGSGSVDIASGSGSRFKTNLQTAQIYVKSDKLVVHYRTAANQSRFYYITLTGTVNPTWTYSATEP